MAASQPTNVHQVVARTLADNGVETMFGVMGDANMFMADSFIRDCGGRFVAGQHEAGCAVMALGYALISDKVGVCSVTHGAAVTNTITAVVEGVKGSTPMVLLCGDTATEDRENVQNVAQREFLVAAGAGFEQLRSPRTAAEDVARALRRAVVERRPIAVNLPYEYDWAEATYEPVRAYVPDSRATVTASDDLDNAIGIIAAARRPLILAGRGANTPEAKAALLRLAARIQAPLATTLKAKDLFHGDPFDLGIFGTVSLSATVDTVMESDCIIAFGASLNRYTMSGGTFAKGKRIVQVSLEPAEIGRNIVPDAGLVGDYAQVADLIVHWLDEAEIEPSGFRSDELAGRIAAQWAERSPIADNGNGTVDFRNALEQLDRIFPADRLYVAGGGRFMRKAWTTVRATDPRSFINSANYGSIGLGMGYAIGAATAVPTRPTVLIEGDGGFMHAGLAEFNTAVRNKLDLIVAICNDACYGAEHIKFRDRQMDVANVLFDWPDLAPVAQSLGGEGVTVRSAADWDAVERAVANRTKPLLIDIKLDPDLVSF